MAKNPSPDFRIVYINPIEHKLGVWLEQNEPPATALVYKN